jgi:2-methylisocitrate lyase-like PEP mutase family enzyme
MSAGKRFREALKENAPLQIVGTINAYQALQATKVGHKAIYLSGGGIANASYGLPDLGMTMIKMAELFQLLVHMYINLVDMMFVQIVIIHILVVQKLK